MSPHPNDCACWQCVNKLYSEAANNIGINGQIEVLVAAISDFDLQQLLPVLKTLQWIRDNEMIIRQRVAP